MIYIRYMHKICLIFDYDVLWIMQDLRIILLYRPLSEFIHYVKHVQTLQFGKCFAKNICKNLQENILYTSIMYIRASTGVKIWFVIFYRENNATMTCLANHDKAKICCIINIHMRLVFLSPSLIGSINDRMSILTNWQVVLMGLRDNNQII